MSTKLTCPQCGASVTFQSSMSAVAICEYCKSTLVRHDVNLENVGKMADLKVDGSPLQLGAYGKYAGVHFAVAGRIQYRFDRGLWNEWFLVFDDMRVGGGWLGEARGSYAISFLSEVSESIPQFHELEAGRMVRLNGLVYQIEDLQSARCIAGEGELPFKVGAGYEAPVADLKGPARKFATLDYSEDKPLVFLGELVEFAELGLGNLRAFDGW